MSDADRVKWDVRYEGLAGAGDDRPNAFLASHASALPARGRALDVACGAGRSAVWLAARGLHVDAVDISPNGLVRARTLAVTRQVSSRVRTVAWDLDAGLPEGCDAGYDLVVCLRFRPQSLMPALVAALAPGGLLIAEVFTRIGAALGLPGPSGAYLAESGELLSQIGELRPVVWREGIVEGRAVAQLVAQRAPWGPVEL